jgi:hypothetical protein
MKWVHKHDKAYQHEKCIKENVVLAAEATVLTEDNK